MITLIILVFVVGYLAIALEHPLKVDKTASALLLGMLLWIFYAMGAHEIIPAVHPGELNAYIADNPSMMGQSEHHQAMGYLLNVDLVEHLGDICQTILFLLGAMTIVELIDVHGGFDVITRRIHTRRKKQLLWVLAIVTFVLSAVLDNLTTTIVMLTLLRKFVANRKERWLYAGGIIIAANTGGAWSPIGDVTTIMLWVKGNVTVAGLIKYVLLPSIVAMVVPIAVMSRSLKGNLAPVAPKADHPVVAEISDRERMLMLVLGVAGLLFVPVFKSITHLPPFIGILFVLGLLWTFTECFYNGKMLPKAKQLRIPSVIARIDMPSVLFFLGILMAVAVLQSTGVLNTMSSWLDDKIHNIVAIDTLLGALSSVVDNVPMVAAAMGMYPVTDPGTAGYMADFVVDGHFWGLLSYCAGVGGSILIIGSASGVIAMGIEKINFGWYLRKISWLALGGYLAGVAVYVLEIWLF